ncbi:acyl-CoA thioesterase [Enemella sp. A6]|uniref:acyl-CoA thioesterase n=1 Tax=Enemella sp. A6 TaxID=3440152 RepID=UPI003EB9E732
MSVMDEIAGVRRTTRRTLAWAETDAAGHNHFSAAVRWLEEGEHELWRELGLIEMVPRVPRLHLEIDFADRIMFGDPLDVTVGIIKVGKSSATFGTVIEHAGDSPRLAIECRHVVVHVSDKLGRSAPWPDEVRELLLNPQA